MNEEIKREVQEINDNVQIIRIKVGGSWTALWRGVLTGFGSVAGAFVAILIIGWVLNIVGIIPAFREQASLWRQTLMQSQGRQIEE